MLLTKVFFIKFMKNFYKVLLASCVSMEKIRIRVSKIFPLNPNFNWEV